MSHYTEQRADSALNGDSPELLASFLANADAETVDAIRKIINADDSEQGDLIYEKLKQYAGNL